MKIKRRVDKGFVGESANATLKGILTRRIAYTLILVWPLLG